METIQIDNPRQKNQKSIAEMTPEERIEAVTELTRMAWEFKKAGQPQGARENERQLLRTTCRTRTF